MGAAEFIKVLIYTAIILLAVVTLAIFANVVKGINKINSARSEKDRKNRRTTYVQGGIQTTADVHTWEDTLSEINDFSSAQISYSVAEQLIPVFPLLGILGTVLGLMQQLSAGSIEALRDALGTSMGTTLWGLLAAIGLRLLDAFWVSKKVTGLELYFDMFEQQYQMAQDKREQDEVQA